MAENNNQTVEKVLRTSVFVLSISIVVVMVLLVKGVFLDKAGAPRSSIEKQLYDAQEAIDENPKDLRAHLMLGITYSQMGKYAEAEEEYKSVIKADKKSDRAWYLLAINYEKQDKLDKAIETLEKLKDEQSIFQLGRMYVENKDYKKAVEALTKALKKRQTASDSLYYLGLAYEKLGNKKDAKTNYEKALKFAPEYKPAKDGLSRVK